MTTDLNQSTGAAAKANTKHIAPDPAKRTMARTNWGLVPQFGNIPMFLQGLPWANWTAEPRGGGKYHKVPRNPHGGWMASIRRKEQWATFDEVKAAYEAGHFDGIGVLVSSDAKLVGIDLDDWQPVLTAHPNIEEALNEFLGLGGYLETSPSGNGLRAFVSGALGYSGKKAGGLEIYSDSRFLTVTGHVLETIHA
jgi:putative DNA primase/helicase